METQQITVSTLVDAPVSKVWQYWNEPQHITQWNFAHESWHCPASENDLRPGGKLKSRMEARDGSFGFDFEAIYDEVTEHQSISYTMPDGRKATTTFEDQGGKTLLSTTFDAEGTNPAEMQRDGWQAIADNFRNYAESH